MRVVWVLTVLHLIAGGTSSSQVRASAPPPHEQQAERVTIGFYATQSACERMRTQLSHARDFEPGSAQCVKELN